MAKYIIKNNLPDEIHNALERRYGTFVNMGTSTARNMFLKTVYFLNNYTEAFIVDINYRSEKRKPLRGTIQVEIDGFYYYVELYKE